MAIREIHSDLPIPPGNFLQEVLDDLGMGKEELAARMNRPASKLSQIFNGNKAITPETALQLEKVTGVAANIWTGLENEYRLTLARLDERENLKNVKSEIPLLAEFAYSELSKYGFVQKKSKSEEKVIEFRKFHGVTSLHNLSGIKKYQCLYRQVGKTSVSPEALTSWIRVGEIKSALIKTDAFDSQKVIDIIPDIRSMTLKNPSDFMDDLVFLLAKCGIALVIVPHFQKTLAHGATFSIRKDKVVIMLSIRGSWADIFWFSLFHEIGHVILHKRKDILVEGFHTDIKLEEAADNFAQVQLLPVREFQEFVLENSFTKIDIKAFAKKIGVHPGIVVGRLQHEGVLKSSWCNDLREQYKWINSSKQGH